MIYFLINNNYHLELDLKLAKELSNWELGLIQVPYSLKVITQSDVFSKIYHFPDKIFLSVRNPFDIFKIQKKVCNELNPTCDDILFVHTDMDLLNQYIIQRFHEVSARIFLLEDGTATMCTYNIKPQRAPFKNRFKAFALRNIYNLRYTRIFVYGAETLPVMNDSVFNGIIVNWGNNTLRKINLYKLSQIKESFDILYENGAVFYNQGLYLWYCTEEEYVKFLSDILIISKQFDPFYFKFHPSDTETIKQSITNLITEQYPNISIILDNEIAERITEKYPVKYAITFNSTVAFNLINKGIIPIFLNFFFHNKFPDPSFAAFNRVLETIGCNVPAKISEVRPDFKGFTDELCTDNTYTITDILKYD